MPGFDVIYPVPGAPDNEINNRSQIVVIAPEDLDVDITAPNRPNLLFILGNPDDNLDLTVRLTNRGANDATNYQLIVTIGDGLALVDPMNGVPTGCVLNGTAGMPIPTPLRPILNPPVVLPAAAVYLCTGQNPKSPTTSPNGTTDSFTFQVQKSDPGLDLTFRADVVGQITNFDGSNVAGNGNYSFDSVLARIIGFNLNKSLQSCTEQPVFPVDPANPVRAANVQIGEDCTYVIEASWFGFLTPGFGQIGIREFNITDIIPAGQGFVSVLTTVSDTGAADLREGPDTDTAIPAGLVNTLLSSPNPITALDPITLALWQYNTDLSGVNNPITANVTIESLLVTRTLNNNNNARNELKTNTLEATFEVDFDGPGGVDPILIEPPISGNQNYPSLADRQVSLTIFEPNLVVTKRVCNRTLKGTCSAENGDADDVYEFMIRIYNDSTIPAVGTAFETIVLDTLDARATPTLLNLNADGRDNNRDGAIDDAAEIGIATYLAPLITFTPDVVPAGIPLLTQIDAGQAIDLFYTVDIDNGVVPGQVVARPIHLNARIMTPQEPESMMQIRPQRILPLPM